MLLLYELPVGFCVFESNANNLLLKKMCRFKNAEEAMQAMQAVQAGKMCKPLKKFLKKNVPSGAELGVAEQKLAASISKKLSSLKIVCNNDIDEHMRRIRDQIAELANMGNATLHQAGLGLAHTLNRHELKFKAEKMDVMVIQAIGLLDDLDKEINNYQMRIKEWFGWHFPEMQKIILDNMQYARVVLKCGTRAKIQASDLSDIISSDLESDVKQAAKLSMGTALTKSDQKSICQLCTEVLQSTEYRAQLTDYLRDRMTAIAPNLTAMVGELVGARLISHAGSLINLAKAPASTIQLYGAEKALFRALKKRHETPKYGLLYHATLVGQAPNAGKGKMARMLGNQLALCTRFDALNEAQGKASVELATERKAKMETTLRKVQALGEERPAKRQRTA
eukprot:NODE_1455_length_1328_cov_77.321399_g1442_i0.p1 GENE.NODE_1455_length_1328_cov_77.321399_g1442_i0~~NODE_1455_length_1328_cov_77.321399_g1442_i0.p1  ORF type:complete len:395 (-),score=120.83 NODE_1455_length_1328_cov_77.321399_g1442_i0:77-1261(-)